MNSGCSCGPDFQPRKETSFKHFFRNHSYFSTSQNFLRTFDGKWYLRKFWKSLSETCLRMVWYPPIRNSVRLPESEFDIFRLGFKRWKSLFKRTMTSKFLFFAKFKKYRRTQKSFDNVSQEIAPAHSYYVIDESSERRYPEARLKYFHLVA